MINSSTPRRPQRWPSRPWQAALYYARKQRLARIAAAEVSNAITTEEGDRLVTEDGQPIVPEDQ